MKFLDLGPTLAPIPWATIGAAAPRLYMPERLTDDLDILIAEPDEPVVTQQLLAAGFRCTGQPSIGGSTRVAPGGSPVDVIVGGESWVRPALVDAQSNRDAQGLPVLPMTYLVLMKMRASRVQGLADVARMLGQASDADLAEVREVFALWQPAERIDLESLAALGRLEMDAVPEGGTPDA